MKRLTTEHWLLIAGFFAATATVIGGLDHWEDIGKPAIVSGFLMQLAVLIRSIFSAPLKPKDDSVSPRLPLVLLVASVGGAVLAFSGCASVPLKQKLSTAHQSVREAIVQLDEAERQLCGPAPAQPNHCTTIAAQVVGLTDARHQAISRQLVQAYETDIKAGTALIAWRAGDPPPTDLTQLLTDAQETLAAIQALSYLPLVEKAQTFVARAQALLARFQ